MGPLQDGGEAYLLRNGRRPLPGEAGVRRRQLLRRPPRVRPLPQPVYGARHRAVQVHEQPYVRLVGRPPLVQVLLEGDKGRRAGSMAGVGARLPPRGTRECHGVHTGTLDSRQGSRKACPNLCCTGTTQLRRVHLAACLGSAPQPMAQRPSHRRLACQRFRPLNQLTSSETSAKCKRVWCCGPSRPHHCCAPALSLSQACTSVTLTPYNCFLTLVTCDEVRCDAPCPGVLCRFEVTANAQVVHETADGCCPSLQALRCAHAPPQPTCWRCEAIHHHTQNSHDQ